MLKDITLGQYLPGKSLIHRLDPRTKILLTIVYIAMIFCVSNPVWYVIPLAFLILCAKMSGLKAAQLLKTVKPLRFLLILTFQIILTVVAEAGAPFLAGIFVRYNTNLLDMTVHAFRSYSISFLFMGFSIYASSFFTALNDGFVSAVISFCRTMIFETGAVIILPFFLGVSGIWYSIIAAEFMAVCLSLFFLIRKAKKYGYT